MDYGWIIIAVLLVGNIAPVLWLVYSVVRSVRIWNDSVKSGTIDLEEEKFLV